MYSLSQTIARDRLLYASPMIAAPSVMLIDMPPRNRGAGLALGRYYAIVLETDQERAELDQFLDLPREAPVAPDLLDRRPSGLFSDNVLISRYEPPADGWPWLLVCRWPEDYSAAARQVPGCDMARGCYTMGVFRHGSELEAHSLCLIEQLATHSETSIRMISPQSLSAAGRA